MLKKLNWDNVVKQGFGGSSNKHIIIVKIKLYTEDRYKPKKRIYTNHVNMPFIDLMKLTKDYSIRKYVKN